MYIHLFFWIWIYSSRNNKPNIIWFLWAIFVLHHHKIFLSRQDKRFWFLKGQSLSRQAGCSSVMSWWLVCKCLFLYSCLLHYPMACVCAGTSSKGEVKWYCCWNFGVKFGKIIIHTKLRIVQIVTCILHIKKKTNKQTNQKKILDVKNSVV